MFATQTPSGPEVIGEHEWDTGKWAKDKSVTVYVWRFGG
jgi:hypothetical protein